MPFTVVDPPKKSKFTITDPSQSGSKFSVVEPGGFAWAEVSSSIQENELAAADAGMSTYGWNTAQAALAEQENESAPGRVIRGALQSAADVVANPLLMAEAALGSEQAEIDLSARQHRSDRDDLKDKSWVESTASAVANSLADVAVSGSTGGFLGILGNAGLKSYGRAERAALRESKTPEEATKIARANAALEMGVTAAFQVVGLGGLEKAFLQGAKGATLRRVAKQVASELAEEELITLGQNLASQGNAGKPSDYANTAIQTVLTFGTLHGSQKAIDFITNPSRSNARKVGLAETSQKERQQTAEAVNQARSHIVDPLRLEHHQQLLPGPAQEATPPPESPPPTQPINSQPQVEQDSEPPADPYIPDSGQAGFVPSAFFQLDSLKESAGRGYKNFNRWVKQNFTSHGEKNAATVELLSRRDGYLRREFSALQQNVSDIQRAAKKAYGVPAYRQLPDTVGQTLDDALKGNTPINQLPPDVALEVQKARDHIDALSQHVMSLPGISPELQLSITNNMGVYVTRTYKKFGTGKDAWIRKALGDQQIMDDFAIEVRQVSPQATDDEIRQLATVLLNKDTIDLADVGQITPRSQKYVNVLKQRQNISPAVRKLYGERTDLFENYVETVGKVANLVANKAFVNELRSAGLQHGFFTDPNSQTPQPANYDHVREVNHKQIPQLKPLAGLLMEQEIADSINDIFVTHLDGKAMRVYMGAMGLLKASKTVGSVQATVRNFTGNLPIAIANGSFQVKDFAGAAKDTFIVELFQRGTAADKARLRRYHELGLIEGVSVEALADIAKQVSVSVQDYIAGVDAVSGIRGVGRSIPKFYQSMDTVWKVYGYENELRVLKDAFPNMPQDAVERMAADRMRNLTPTYSAASKAAKFWSRKVPVGDFAMFYSEMIRTSANRARIIREDLRSGNPVLRKHAARRIAGQAAVLAVPSMVAIASRALLGVSDEEDEAVRQRIAPWQENSPLIYTSFDREKGRFEYFDGAYNDPFSGFSKPAIALLRGEVQGAGETFAEPFISESLLVGTLAGIFYNRKPDGGTVYDPGQSAEEQNKQIRDWTLQRAEPGTVTTMRRIYRGARGQVSDSGKVYELGNELTAIGGVRLEGMDRAQSDGFRNREFHSRIESAQSSIRRTLLSKGTFDAEQASERILAAESNRKELLSEWRKFVDGSVLLGETNPYGKVVSDIGRASTIAKMMYSKSYSPYRLQAKDVARMRTLPQGEQRVAIYQKLFREAATVAPEL